MKTPLGLFRDVTEAGIKRAALADLPTLRRSEISSGPAGQWVGK